MLCCRARRARPSVGGDFRFGLFGQAEALIPTLSTRLIGAKARTAESAVLPMSKCALFSYRPLKRSYLVRDFVLPRKFMDEHF